MHYLLLHNSVTVRDKISVISIMMAQLFYW